MVKKSPAQIDSLLEALLRETDDARADDILSQLISDQVGPIIRGVIRYKLHFNSRQQAEADDLYQEILVQFLAEVRQFRQQPEEHPITDPRGFAAIIAHRACSRWMRRQFP